MTMILSALLATAVAQTESCDALLALAVTAAKTGTEMARVALAGGDFAREIKSDGSLVTAVDLAVSRELVRILEDGSGLPVFSEESEPPPLGELMSWPRFWLIDPIDGTENFARSGTDFSVLVALMERGPDGRARPLLGVIGRPAENEIYYAAEGRGSWRARLDQPGQEPQRLLSRSSRPRVLRATTQKRPQTLIGESVYKDAFVFERVGGNGAKFIALADGRVDCYLAQPMKWWDMAAGDALWRYSVKDGESPRTSCLEYRPLPGAKLFFQGQGYVLGASGLSDAAVGDIVRLLNRARAETGPRSVE